MYLQGGCTFWVDVKSRQVNSSQIVFLNSLGSSENTIGINHKQKQLTYDKERTKRKMNNIKIREFKNA
jgi:hypothetical protein